MNYFIPNKTSILSQFLISLSLTNIKIKISSKYYIRYVRVFSLTFHIFFMKKLIECTNFTLPVFQYNCTYSKSILRKEFILKDSIDNISKVNLKKELKIEFIHEEKINDAGGLLREWVHIIC